MDAITLLKQDHDAVRALFREFEGLGDNATQRARQLADKIIEELSIHANIEEQLFYPAVRKCAPEALDDVLESLEEHHVVKWVLSEVEGMDPSHERFKAKMTVLIENVKHHAEEEEEEMFPKVRDSMGRDALAELGSQMEELKKVAPTRPHPRSPDTPPGNLVAGALSGVIDKARSAGKDAVDRATSSRRPASRKKKATARKATAKKKATTAKKVAKRTASTAKKTVKRAGATAKRRATTAKKTVKRAAPTKTGTARKTAARKTAARKTTAVKRATTKRATTAKRTAAKATRGVKKATKAARSTKKR